MPQQNHHLQLQRLNLQIHLNTTRCTRLSPIQSPVPSTITRTPEGLRALAVCKVPCEATIHAAESLARILAGRDIIRDIQVDGAGPTNKRGDVPVEVAVEFRVVDEGGGITSGD